VPRHAGVLSALGMLAADVVRDYSASVLRASAELTPADLGRALMPLVRQAERELAAEGFARSRRTIESFVDVRYVGQSYEITLPDGADYRARFDREHGRLYGYSNPARATEVVAVRVRATGVTDKPTLPYRKPRRASAPRPAAVRPGRFSGRKARVAFHRWDDLDVGAAGAGPAVITGGEATVVVPPDFRFRIDGYGNVVATKTRRGATR
jgi:N-methylhydantoinase A/oxoprolinase/acetone carboxylase beta subunit